MNRFQRAFDAGPVQLVQISGITFVIINSMAMEGDDCFLCRPAVNKLRVIASEWCNIIINFTFLTLLWKIAFMSGWACIVELTVSNPGI